METRIKTDEGIAKDVVDSLYKDSRAAIIDLELTQVIDGGLVKIMSWYDNGWGHSSQLVREAARVASEIKDLRRA